MCVSDFAKTIVGKQKKRDSASGGASYFAQVRKIIKMVLEIVFILARRMVVYRQKRVMRFLR
jgi:hypothetical protein